jgi:hypothetical protein
MNTFGLKRKVHTFGLGRLSDQLVEGVHDIVDFVLTIYKKVYFDLSR